MLPLRRSTASLILASCLLLPLASCANSSYGESLQKSFAADPQLTGSSPSPEPEATVAANPNPQASEPANNGSEPAVTNSPTELPQSQTDLGQVPSFTDRTNLGASGDFSTAATQPNSATPSGVSSGQTTFTDLDKAPKELRQPIEDLARLGVLTPAANQAKSSSDQTTSRFEPNKPITRREFASWLVAVNNRLQADRAAQQIRLGSDTSQPAFRDVPRNDPDFAAIQGLAEAGIIPSALSGDSTIVTFRPNATLTRENLVLWKVPMDTRQPLPTANIEAVKQAWGFQDAAKIDPKALRAVLADYENGDLSNIRRVYGYTTLLQPKKAVTRAEAAAALWYFGYQGEGQSAQDALKGGTASSQPAATNQP